MKMRMRMMRKKRKMRKKKKMKRKIQGHLHSENSLQFHLQVISQSRECLNKKGEESGILALEREDWLDNTALSETRFPQESNPQASTLEELLISLWAVTLFFQKKADPSFFS